MLVSEVMLQQTQIARVLPAYLRFMAAFPTVDALAKAPLADVLRAWRGLGYNRRAVSLWKAAKVVVAEHACVMPSDVAALERLPGVGSYTAAAVGAFAFGKPVVAVDTNLRRVVARHRLGAEPLEVGPGALRRAADAWLDRSDPAGWNAALMDLGREVCRPEPLCQGCPLRRSCRFRASGRLPVRPARRTEPFQGSMRQLRGRIVDALRAESSATPLELAPRWGESTERVDAALRALAADGLVEPAPGGGIRLAGAAAAVGDGR